MTKREKMQRMDYIEYVLSNNLTDDSKEIGNLCAEYEILRQKEK